MHQVNMWNYFSAGTEKLESHFHVVRLFHRRKTLPGIVIREIGSFTSVVLWDMTMKFKTKFSRFLGKWGDVGTVVLHLVCLGPAVNFYSWLSLPTTITMCVRECFLNHVKEAVSSALQPTPKRERKKENSSLCWRFSGMSDHNLAIAVTEIPLETRKGESQTPDTTPHPTPPTSSSSHHVPGCFSSTRQENQLWEFVFK